MGKKSGLKIGTIFTLCGDVWGYDITLFNYYYEEEILLEPERKFLVEQIIPPVNEIIHVRCKIENSGLVLTNEQNYIIDNNKETTSTLKEEIKCIEGKNHQINKITGICINCQ